MARLDLALLLVRLGLAITFVFSGLGKIVVGLEAEQRYFSSIGIAWPELLGPGVAILETVAGVGLLLGLAARPLAALLAIEMTVALIAVRLPAITPLWSVVEVVAHIRLEVLLLLCALAIAVAGAGAWSLNAVIDRRWRHRRQSRDG